MKLDEKIKELPKKSGVYFMKDKMDNIIYVGKSKALKNRVRSYFNNNKNHSPKTIEMVSKINDIDFITTDTEFEALLLECKLIKEIKPIYNRLIKNNNKYQYIKITTNEKIPRLIRMFEKDEDKSVYFGPFTRRNRIDEVIPILKKYFHLRTCENVSLKITTNGCIQYQINNCLGPCIEGFDMNVYKKNIRSLIEFLNGKNNNLFNELDIIMKETALKLDFEKAAIIKDEILLLKYFVNSQKVINETIGRKNLIAFEYLNDKLIKIFFIRGNKILYNLKINLKEYINLSDLLYEKIIKLFNNNKHQGELNKEDINEANIIYSYLKNNKNLYFKIPDYLICESKLKNLLNGYINKAVKGKKNCL